MKRLFKKLVAIILLLIPFLGVNSINVSAQEEKLLYEDFESGKLNLFESLPNDKINLHSLPAYPVKNNDQINGAYSSMIIYEATNSYYENCMSLVYNFINSTYTIAFRYQILEMKTPTFFTAKIAHKSNGMLNRGVGIDKNGIVSTHQIDIVSATVTPESDGIYQAVIVINATNEYNQVQFSANGPCKYVVDDFSLYKGTVTNPTFNSISKKEVTVKLVGSSDFELMDDGCMYTNVTTNNDYEIGGAYTSNNNDKINGYYSKIIYSSTQWASDFISKADVLENNKVYTVSYRYKAINYPGFEFQDNSLIIMGMQCSKASSLQKYIAFTKDGEVSYYRKEGNNKIAWMHGIISLNITDSIDKKYKNVEFVFNTNNENDYTFRMGFYGKGAIVVDDLRIYEGNGSLPLSEPQIKSIDDYPSISLRGVRPSTGWVNIGVNLPKAATTNGEEVYIEIVPENGATTRIDYSDNNVFTPYVDGKHTIIYNVVNKDDFKITTSFEMLIYPEPGVPTITLSDADKQACNGYINEIICLPNPILVDDKDNQVEVIVSGPNGFSSNDRMFLITVPGEYKVTYIAENAKGEKSMATYSFNRTEKKTFFDENSDVFIDTMGNVSSTTTPVIIFIVIGSVLLIGVAVVLVILLKRRAKK